MAIEEQKTTTEEVTKSLEYLNTIMEGVMRNTGGLLACLENLQSLIWNLTSVVETKPVQ